MTTQTTIVASRLRAIAPLLALGVVATLPVAALSGCGGSKAASDRTGRSEVRAADQGPVVSVTIDGLADDWPISDRNPVADREFLYIPLSSDGVFPLQGSPETMQLQLDIDANPATGSRESLPNDASVANLGIDLLIEFSPLTEEGIQGGVSAYAIDNVGERTFVGHAGVGLVSLPTHASEFYEMRIYRDLSAISGLPTEGLQSSGFLRGVWVLRDDTGGVVGWADPFEIGLPAASGGPTLASAAVPSKDGGDFRVLSYNVERTAPLNDPGPFGRILQALDPDVILFQEWDEGTATDLEAWLTAQVGGDTWYTIKGEAQGVAIASRLPLRPAGPSSLSLAAAGMSYPVRFVAGIVETPAGDMGVASVHLKCCGTAQSPEDERRVAEAESINAELSQAFAEAPIRVVAGDLNLVGSPEAMRVLRSGLDIDQTDLNVTEALVLGDWVATTWSNPRGRFAPSRLDFALVGDAAASVSRAFVLDSRILSSTALGNAGLEGADTDASDHLPLVIDIRPR